MSDALLLGEVTDGAEFIRLRGITAVGHHGVYPDERRDGQPFVVDVTLRINRAVRADDVSTTVHYGLLAEAVVAIVEGEHVDLIETLASRIADHCLTEPPVVGVVVTVHKPQAPIGVQVEDASVTLVRSRVATTPFVLSLGSNMGDSAAILTDAVQWLSESEGVSVTAVSSLYRTAPVGGVDQDPYLNAVVVGRTALSASDLLALGQRIELAHGRTRDLRWGPRTLDIDVISFGDAVSPDPVLTLPHPRAHDRAFVLVPWLEVDADAALPGRGSAAHLLAEIGTGGVRRAADVDWPFGPPRDADG